MKIRTQDLKGEALNYAATLADKGNAFLIMDHAGALHTCYRHDQHGSIVFTNYLGWSDAGPIIDREDIHWGFGTKDGNKVVIASKFGHHVKPLLGPTALIAAMRCFVSSRLGDEVEIPAAFAI
jgi:hypothetical protein